MCVRRDGEGEAGCEEKKRRGLATVCTIELESLSFPIAPLNFFFFPFPSLSCLPSLSSPFFVLSTSPLHHFPRSFLVSCNLCLGGARCSMYVCVLVDSSLSFLSLFLYGLPSLHLLLHSLQPDSVAFHEVRFRRRVSFYLSFFLSLSFCLSAQLARLSHAVPAFNQAPASQILVRNFAYLYTSVFVNVCVCLYSIFFKICSGSNKLSYEALQYLAVPFFFQRSDIAIQILSRSTILI